MDPKVIYEDEQLLVLDKPAGWIVNEAETTRGRDTIQKWLSKRAYTLAEDRRLRSGIVHRLDKETSGILVVAKTKQTFENLQEQFKKRLVKKTYTALVHGKVEPKEGTVSAPLGRLPWNRERFGVLPGGREAVTNYKVLSVFSSQLSDRGKSVFQLDRLTDKQRNIKPKTENRKQITEYSLVELYPKTGRTHQIRVHLKYLGHPIVSDEFYTGRKTARADRTWCPRLFLHASGIIFTHPSTEKIVSIDSELSADLTSSLTKLKTTD